MVVVEEVTKLSKRRTQTLSETFPDEALASIRAAVEAVPASVFDSPTKHTEVGRFDAAIADGLSQYEYEGDAAGGYNPNCELWSHQGFHYSVDLYDADARIAIEVEKSERKNVSDDLLKNWRTVSRQDRRIFQRADRDHYIVLGDGSDEWLVVLCCQGDRAYLPRSHIGRLPRMLTWNRESGSSQRRATTSSNPPAPRTSCRGSRENRARTGAVQRS